MSTGRHSTPARSGQGRDAAARMGGRRRIGERLVERGLVRADALASALLAQRRTGDRVGEILVADGAVADDALARCLAAEWGLPFLEDPAVRTAPEALDPDVAWELGVVPVRTPDGVRFATPELLHPIQHDWLVACAGGEAPLIVTTGRRVKELLTDAYGDLGLERATYALRENQPESSAHIVWTASQRAVALVLLALLVAGFVLAPLTMATIVLIASLTYYGLHSLYRFKLALDSMSQAGTVPVTAEELSALDDRSLPRYTILVPLYREAEIVDKIVRNIRRLDYPPAKLEVLLLCECDDDETIGAIERGELPANFHLVRVPDGLPRTKPKACNYGLLLARGQLCVIYDAEDRPDPDQLKKAVVAFRKSPPSLACVQAKLNYFNRHQNLLTRWFAAEYAVWFDLVLPGLYSNRHPIPLGGTSNHFRTDVLRDLDAWDPFNVTEDADLGIRLWKRGQATAVIDSVTLEEANSRIHNWVRQRSRWVKGYIQTWLVHMRRPVKLARSVGIGPFLSLQFTVGGILVTLVNPLFWGLALVFLALQPAWLTDIFPGPLYVVAVTQLLLANFLHLYLFLIGLGRREFWDVVPAMLLVPVYWVLMSIAGWKGFVQLFTKPFYWEKTDHGLVDEEEFLEPEPDPQPAVGRGPGPGREEPHSVPSSA